MSRSRFAVLIAAGCLLRAIALPGPGTGDVTVWKVWMYNAARGRVATMYGVGGSPPERRIVTYAGAEAPVDYPPIALYELGAAGRVYRLWSGGAFPNTTALNAFVKLPSIVAEAGLALLIFFAVRQRLGDSIARWTVVAYWLNPAALLDTSVLGYLDAQYVLPVVAALVAAVAGRAAVAGGLLAIAMLTKPQTLFVAPAVMLAIWANAAIGRRATAIGASLLAGAAVAAIAFAPIVAAGGWPNAVQALSRLAHHEMLSANACNFWWLVGYSVRARASMQDLGVWTAFTRPTQILGIPRLMELGYPNPRIVGIVLTLTVWTWALWTGRRARDLWLVAGLGAFLLHAYVTLSAQVHENHLFAVVPLLIVAAAGRRAFRPIAALTSAVVALNLNLFYGFGSGIGYAIPRAVTIVDATVVVALTNCAALLWHARALRIECSTADGSRQSPAPASPRAPAARSRS